MIVRLLTEHHLDFLSLKGGCRGWSMSTHVKMTNCWKWHAMAHMLIRDEHENSFITSVPGLISGYLWCNTTWS